MFETDLARLNLADKTLRSKQSSVIALSVFILLLKFCFSIIFILKVINSINKKIEFKLFYLILQIMTLKLYKINVLLS